MPSVSKKQHNFMAAVANNPAFAKKAGVPQSVGQEFTTADKGKKFVKGGEMKESKGMMKKGGMPPALAKHAAKPASEAHAGLKKGGKVKMAMGGYASGGMPMVMKDGKKVPAFAADGEGKMAKGGKVKKCAAGGLAAGHKAADGIAKQGKTKAKQVAMKKGGMCK